MISLRASYIFLSIKKYSCSGPTVVITFLDVVFPKALKTRIACLFKTSIERNNGVFLSNASPLYEQNAVGIHKEPSFINAGDVQSHAVYPLASKVALSPPDGKEDASGSPLINSFPENSRITLPSAVGFMKASCFSAVIPVIGWNQ